MGNVKEYIFQMSNEIIVTGPSEIELDNKDKEHENEKLHFDFTDDFQKKIAKAILTDRKFAQQIYEVLVIDYFKIKWVKAIIGCDKEFYLKYGAFPEHDVLTQIITDKYLKNEKTRAIAPFLISFLQDAHIVDTNEMKYVKERALEFCRREKMKAAFIECADILGKNGDSARYEAIQNKITKATMAGSETTKGMSLEDDIELRYVSQKRLAIPTGIPELDSREILNGGLGRSEIGFVVAPSGVGKTHYLIQFGAAALLDKKNVAHFTFELKESVTAIRYDSNLTDIRSIDCPENIEKIKAFYKDNKEELGRLRIKFYPTGTATVNTIRSYLEKLKSTEGFVPDLIIVDYAGIMRSTQASESVRHELKYVTEELRALGDEYNAAVWSALQSNRDGVDADFLDLNNLAESFSQAFIADVILGWSRKPEEKATGIGCLRVIKNRAGQDGINYHMALDTSKSKVKALNNVANGVSQAVSPKMAKEVKKDGMKGFIDALRTKNEDLM